MYSYTQELPSRCKKELLKAADSDKDGFINMEELEKLLKNIGEDRLSRKEIEIIISEVSDSSSKSKIRVDHMLQLL